MPAFDYVGHKPEHIVGLDPKNISEEQYDALSWELQQAVLNNRGSDGNPLYQERPSRAERKRVRDLMGPDPDAADDTGADDGAAADDSGRVPPASDQPSPDPALLVIPDASQPQEPAPPDVPAPAAEEGGTA